MNRKFTDETPSLEDIHARTITVYENHAHDWDKHRSRLLNERSWLNQFIQSLPSTASVLDVGCGAGEPIARYLLEHCLSVTGIDSSREMIEICRSRFPDESWRVMDMRKLSLGKQFDGIIAWDSFFHLNQDEQRDTLQRFIQHLRSGGAMLLTIGHEAGEVLGTVEGEAVYHSSLSPDEYKDILHMAGFRNVEIVLKSEDCDRTVLLANQYDKPDNGDVDSR